MFHLRGIRQKTWKWYAKEVFMRYRLYTLVDNVQRFIYVRKNWKIVPGTSCQHTFVDRKRLTVFEKGSLNCQCIETNFLLLFAFLIFNVQFVPRHRSPMIEYGRSLAQVRIAEVTCHIMSLKFSNRATQSMDSLLELFSHIPKWQLCLWTGKTPLRPFFF